MDEFMFAVIHGAAAGTTDGPDGAGIDGGAPASGASVRRAAARRRRFVLGRRVPERRGG